VVCLLGCADTARKVQFNRDGATVVERKPMTGLLAKLKSLKSRLPGGEGNVSPVAAAKSLSSSAVDERRFDPVVDLEAMDADDNDDDDDVMVVMDTAAVVGAEAAVGAEEERAEAAAAAAAVEVRLA